MFLNSLRNQRRKQLNNRYAPLAQLDRASVYGTEGQGFELLMVRQKQPKTKRFGLFFTHFGSFCARLSVCSNKNRKILLEQNAILSLLAKTLENAENGSVLIKVLIKLKTFVQERRLFLLLLTIVLYSLLLIIFIDSFRFCLYFEVRIFALSFIA